MLASYKWLSEYLDLSHISPQELGDKLSRTGLEVEGISSPQDGLKKIVVGDVVSCKKHPNSDHLSVCQVDVGEEELYQIVCGAPNIQAGKKVIVALPSARIVDNVKIKKGKMRGEVSLGMICSLQELGYDGSLVMKEYAEGIYFLPEDAEVGSDVFPYLDMDDALIDISITPNRADALSIRGLVYEIAAIYDQTPHLPEIDVVEDTTKQIQDYLSVDVTDDALCPTYCMRVIDQVTVKESPQWLQNKLMNAGLRPINNIVDVTNYTLLLFGQPLHAFDYDKVTGAHIYVRCAEKDEVLVTLDGQERQLSEHDIVIADDQEAIALAGIMGGANTEIDHKTVTVALESALFDKKMIRKSSQAHHVRTESSQRFEKGVDPNMVRLACDFAAQLIAELGSGKVVSGHICVGQTEVAPQHIEITLTDINQVLGTELVLDDVTDIMRRLGFHILSLNGEQLTVEVPTRRQDVRIPEDLVEEVARIYGYDVIPSTLPKSELAPGMLTKQQHLLRKIKQNLVGQGFFETINYSLTTSEKNKLFTLPYLNRQEVSLAWPMSQERSVLRKNLLAGLLDTAAYNIAHNNDNLALFELGKVFNAKEQELPEEHLHLGCLMTGMYQQSSWHQSGILSDFFVLKGALEQLFILLGCQEHIAFQVNADDAAFHPGRCANLLYQGEVIGILGEIHPNLAHQYDLGRVYACEINMTQLLAMLVPEWTFTPISKYPSVSRDISLLVPEQVTHQDIITTIQHVKTKYLTDVTLFDVYESDIKSMSYRLVFHNNEATLTDEEIVKEVQKITDALIEQLNITLR